MQIKNFFRYISSFLWGYTFENTSSKVNPVLEVCYVNGKTLLNSENVNYSYGSCYDAFNTIFKKFKIKEKQLDKVLILGFGVGCIAHLLENVFQKDSKIVGVEKDEKVLELGVKYFDTLKLLNVIIICGDAIDYMQKNTELFDLIVVDVFIDYVVPEKCEQELFLNNIRRSLASSGMLVFNKLEIKNQATSTLDTLKTSFKNTMPDYTIHQLYKDEPNYMFVYTNEYL
jgi:spermidine synthase